MFEALFGRKARPSPQEFANRLLSIAFDADMHGHFYDLLKMTEAERRRYVFTAYLFTTTLPMTWISATLRTDLPAFVPQACALTLQAWQSKDAFVRLGDFIITDYEFDRLPQTLERLYQQRVPRWAIQDHKLRLGELLDATAYVRGDRQVQELREVVESDRPPAEHPEILFGLYGVRLLTYIYTQESVHEWSGWQTMQRNTIFDSLVRQIYERALVVYKAL
jgi:hypothetical protein